MSLIIRLLTCFFKHVFLCTSQIRIKTLIKMNMFIFFSWCIIKNYEFVCKFFLVFSLVWSAARRQGQTALFKLNIILAKMEG